MRLLCLLYRPHLYAAGLNSLAQVVPNSPKLEIKGGDQSVQVAP